MELIVQKQPVCMQKMEARKFKAASPKPGEFTWSREGAC